MIKYIKILFFFLPLLLSGCTQEPPIDPDEDSDGYATFSIATRGGGLGASLDDESTVKTLRMMAFDADGNQVLNKLYQSADGNLEAILKDPNGVYHIREKIAKEIGYLKICLIANERVRWDLSRSAITYTRLKSKVLKFDDDFTPSLISPTGDLDIVLGGNNLVMFAESDAYIGSSDASVEMSLVRTIAKVTLNLQYDLANIQGVNFATGDSFTINSAYIQNQPMESYLNGTTEYSGVNFLATSGKAFNIPTPVVENKYVADPLTFYIPEHLLSDESFNSGTYTYIQVLATHTINGVAIPMTYRVPLGNGFENPNTNPVKADYTISRNTHYIINGEITKLGELDGIYMILSVRDWVPGEDVNVDNKAPYLNVSNIFMDVTLDPTPNYPSVGPYPVIAENDIVFWTNQPQDSISIEPISCRVFRTETDYVNYENYVNFNEYFTDGSVYSTNLIKYTSGDKFSPNNGLIISRTEMNDQFLYPGFFVMEKKFYIKAGKLKREITIKYQLNQRIS